MGNSRNVPGDRSERGDEVDTEIDTAEREKEKPKSQNKPKPSFKALNKDESRTASEMELRDGNVGSNMAISNDEIKVINNITRANENNEITGIFSHGEDGINGVASNDEGAKSIGIITKDKNDDGDEIDGNSERYEAPVSECWKDRAINHPSNAVDKSLEDDERTKQTPRKDFMNFDNVKNDPARELRTPFTQEKIILKILRNQNS